jgi:diaminopropionate ammonia-lyase
VKSPLPYLRFMVNDPMRWRDHAVDTTTGEDPISFHRRLPGYQQTPVRSLPRLAAMLGVGEIWAKDESSRLGLPSFKILGASWAAYRAICERLGGQPDWQTTDELKSALEPHRPLILRTATDGNHGRALAWFARRVGLRAEVLVPDGTAQARIRAIRAEGAAVTVVDGSYDDAVRRAAVCDRRTTLVISDTSWPGYETIPTWIIEGYGTIFREAGHQLPSTPDVVAVPLGVGALGAAAAEWARGSGSVQSIRLLGVEPATAACVLASVSRGRPTNVPGPHRSIMAGLNCGMPSLVALPSVASTFRTFAAIDDALVCDAMRVLASEGVEAGETGAAALAGLLAVMHHAPRLVAALGLGASARVLLLITEGATDPHAYDRIVGASA